MKLALLALSLVSLAAPAQTIYQCSVNGVVSYADQPCVSGPSRVLATPPAESSATTLARQQSMSEQLAITRHRREAQEAREQERTAKLAAAQHKKCAALSLQLKWAEQDAAGATERAVTKRTLKARRIAEKLASACPA